MPGGNGQENLSQETSAYALRTPASHDDADGSAQHFLDAGG